MLTGGPTEEEQKLISKHFDYLNGLVEKGVVILAGRTLTTDKTSFGIVIFQAETEEAARKIMNNDPAVKNMTNHYAVDEIRQTFIFPYT